jgi:hypothetical protein
LALCRGLTLAAGSAISGAAAGGGLALLLFLLLTVSLAPASDTISRPLTLDFSQSSADLVGEAVFLPEGQLRDGLLPAVTQRDARQARSTAGWCWLAVLNGKQEWGGVQVGLCAHTARAAIAQDS